MEGAGCMFGWGGGVVSVGASVSVRFFMNGMR
jgi:hypothetical protein